jgi:hypothetical protein
VQSKGHEVWVEDSTTTRAIVCGKRKGSEQVQKSVWTMDRAKGLKIDQKENWRKQPQAMLIARATAELCRLIASDVILGIPYAVEELGDDDGTTEAAPRAKRTAKRQPIETVELPEPEVPALEATAETPAPAVAVEPDGQAWPEPPADWEPTP